MKQQSVLYFLPGYMFDGDRLISTGAALAPTQHIHPETGELVYYVRPIWEHGGACIGMYIRHKGILDYLKKESTSSLQDQ